MLGFLPSGWRNVPDGWETFEVTADTGEIHVEYSMAEDACEVTVNGEDGSVQIHSLDVDRADLEYGGLRRECTVHMWGDQYLVTCPDGQSTLTYSPRFRASGEDETLAGGPTAPMPGLVIAVPVQAGDVVEAGDTLVVLEAMKMEHQVRSSVRARVTNVLVQPGQSVEAHQLLAKLEEAE